MTVAYDITASRTDGNEWFGRVGTTPPTVMRGRRKFITCVFMAGCATTSTLSTVTPADAFALSTITAQPSTLAAIPGAACATARPARRSRHASAAAPPVWAQLGRDRPRQLGSRGALSTTGLPVPAWRPCTMPGYLSWAGWSTLSRPDRSRPRVPS